MIFENNEQSTTSYQSNLMSPPMTPKFNSMNGSPEDDDYVTILPPTNQTISSSSSSLLYRKTSLSHTIHAMILANRDTLDITGKCFSIPFDYHQHRSSSSKRRRSHRTKSLPRPSPTTANSRGVFTMNVFDRPRKKRHSLSSLSLSLSSSNTVYNPLTSPSPSPTSTISSVSTSSSSSSSSSTTTSPLTDIGNKPKADTFFYDHINLSVQDHDIFDPAWIPLWESFDNRPSIRVIWKGSPLSIQHLPYYQQLHTNEQSIASTLRLTPEQYLKCKRALILSAKVFHQHGLPFRKSDAQKVCRIDVNKTSCLWGAFNRLGWFYPR